VIDDVGEFVGVEAEVQGVQDGADQRDAEIGLEMRAVVPGQRRDTVARLDTERLERRREAASARVKSANVYLETDLSALRHTISRRRNICSARRKIAATVRGKSIIRPFMRRIVSGTARAAATGTNYPSGVVRPHRADGLGHTKACKFVQKRVQTLRHRSCGVRGVAPRSLLVDHAAEILGVSRRTIYYRIRQGRLRTVRTRCGSQRVLVESIEALLREQRERAAKKRRPKKRDAKEPGHNEAGRRTLAPGDAPESGVAAERTTTGTAGVLSTNLFGKSRVLWQQR